MTFYRTCAIKFYFCTHVMYEVITKQILHKNYNCSREPESIIRPKKSDSPEEDNKYNEKLEKAKSKAVRHLFLIRHGQYNVEGVTDKERILTELGNIFKLCPSLA